MDNAMIQILVLAAVAVFLILRLRSVLGTREGFEPERIEQVPNASGPIIDAEAEAHDALADHAEPGSQSYEALAAMQRVEPAFDVDGFLGGARAAYEMIVLAFEQGDLSEVRPYMAPELAAAFDEAIAQRAAAGHSVDAQYLGTRETALNSAHFDAATNEAELSVRFVGEMIVATRDASGAIVAGDPKSPRKQRDVWTFARVMGASDPNWQLVATGA